MMPFTNYYDWYDPYYDWNESNYAWVDADDYPSDEYFTGALSDVSLPGIVFPPLGIYQAVRSRPSGKPSPKSPAAEGGWLDWFNRPSDPKDPGRGSGIDWSFVTKVGLIAGSALTVYLIYRASKTAETVTGPLARATGEALAARYGGQLAQLKMPGAARAIVQDKSGKNLLTA